MPVMNIYTCFDPVLREKAKKIQTIDQWVEQLIDNMIDTMYKANGIGLAAPQVGESVQLIICSPTLEPGKEVVLINPVITKTQGSCVFEEGCLSIPEVYAKVKRPEKVTVQALDRQGNHKELNAEGLLARVLQHEIDHLNGVLFIDRLAFWQKTLLLRQAKSILKKRDIQ